MATSNDVSDQNKSISESVIAEVDAFQRAASRFRDLVNEPRRHHALFQRQRAFNLVCSAMDIIDDTLFALRSYAEHRHSDQGLAYLEIFGVLQALYVQQDAVSQIYKGTKAETVDLEKKYPDIAIVRDTRIRVAGHPVGGLSASHFLVRYTVSKWGFALWTYNQAGHRTSEHVELPALIMKNSRALNKAVSELIEWMEADNRQHREKFLGELLTDIFKAYGYLSSKLFEGISDRNPIGGVASTTIREMLIKFRKALNDRSSHFQREGFVTYDIPRIEYALDKYDQYMAGDVSQNEYDAYIIASFVRSELSALVEIANDIDRDYKK